MSRQLQQWDPLREFDRIHDEVDRLFRGSSFRRSSTSAGESYPCPVDIVETEKELRVVAEIPGVRHENVHVNVENQVLTISGDKTSPHGEGDNVLRTERFFGSFSRSFTLPQYVDAEKIEANYRDGVLILNLPKRPETQPRQIQVKVK